MMLFTWPALWTIAGLLWWHAPPRSGVRWAAITALCGGCGALSVVIGDMIIPEFVKNELSESMLLWQWAEMITSIISQWGLPYAFLQFAVQFTNALSARRLHMLHGFSAIPIALMFLFTPITPPIIYHFMLNLSWAGPYLLVSLFLLISKEWHESNGIVRKNRRFTNLVAVPPILFHFITNYVLRAFQIENIWYWNGAVIWLVFGGFLWLLIRRGIFGIRLHAEQERHDWSWQAVRTGTSVLHHAMKNEMNQLNWLVGRMADQNTSMGEGVESIRQSLERMNAALHRLHRQTADIEICNQDIQLSVLVGQFFEEQRPRAERDGIQLELIPGPEVNVVADGFHLREALKNVWNNSLESFRGPSGQVTLTWHLRRGELFLSIQDNGCGIAETELRNIFRPYFSTKGGGENYGFGLFYVYEIMRRHQGWIDVHSKKDTGTRISFVFPKRRVRQFS